MENQNLTEIICILDKSGSMEPLKIETIAGLNQFLEDQRQETGDCNFSLVQFNHEVVPVINRVPIGQVQPLNKTAYEPAGYTALFDAVGQTLATAMETQFFLSENQKSSRVLVFIITDGMENASRSYTGKQVSEMIQKLTLKGWEFQFFGANIDAFGEAKSIGIMQDKAHQWEYNRAGVHSMLADMSMKSMEFRNRAK